MCVRNLGRLERKEQTKRTGNHGAPLGLSSPLDKKKRVLILIPEWALFGRVDACFQIRSKEPFTPNHGQPVAEDGAEVEV
jgi:hypothetical protein